LEEPYAAVGVEISSLSRIQRAQQHAKKAKKEADVAGLFDKAPCALLKLEKKNLDASKLTKDEICSIAHRCFATTLDKSQKKPKLVDELNGLVAKHPQVLPTSIAEVRTTPALAVAMANEENGDDDDDDEGEEDENEEVDGGGIGNYGDE